MIDKAQPQTPRPREIATRCQQIRSQWTREISRARQYLAATKQRELLLRVITCKVDCRNAV